MSPDLTADDFPAFFQAIHGHPPFPWQTRLARLVAEDGTWPAVLDLPTGFGKTAALDVAVFTLALDADRGAARRAPVRIALVVDRRLVVDDAFARAERIVNALADPGHSVIGRVADRLWLLAGPDAPPLVARRLRGGIPREDDWARTPSQPTILCSTVDQVGSRLLFRGYGVSDRMKPVHAGLVGADCLILLDEAHLSEPFRQTLHWVRRYRENDWRQCTDAAAPWGVSLLTATPGDRAGGRVGLEPEDYADPVLATRWHSPKPARLVDLGGMRTAEADDGNEAADQAEERRRVKVIVGETLRALMAMDKNSALGVVVNRVGRARTVFEELGRHLDSEAADRLLMIGPARPVDRDDLAGKLKPIRTGCRRELDRPLVIVATQCVEAGVDIDLDGLVTDAAPVDALRQRFGRLNRAGRNITPHAAIVGGKADAKDPVYGTAAGEAWTYLTGTADGPPRKGADAVVDFGLAAFAKRSVPEDALSPKPDAPVLLPAHLDLLSQTSPVPAADPEVALYLHGPDRAADAVSVIWRADVDTAVPKEGMRRLLLLVPPRAAEAIDLPVWAVRRWLEDADGTAGLLADIPAAGPEEATLSRRRPEARPVFRWAGDDDRSAWIRPGDIRPGDAVVVPAAYGGVDEFGWTPDRRDPAADVADKAARPFVGRHFAVRVAPGLLTGDDDGGSQALAQAIVGAETRHWRDLRDAVAALPLPDSIREALGCLDHARKGRRSVEARTDLYGVDEDGRPRGVVFVARSGLKGGGDAEDGHGAATEDDMAGSLPGYALPLDRHAREVEAVAEAFARRAGLAEERVLDLKVAGYCHDIGKADPRFQGWLAFGDPLGTDPAHVLAKSARPLPREARARTRLPDHWRHEALSVRLAPLIPRFAEAKDADLVLWLVGTHHGHGRPFFPHADPEDREARTGLPGILGLPLSTLPPGAGPQSLAYDRDGLDWPALYECLKARYGVWELARLEAILRLADHRASEEAALRLAEDGASA